MDAVLYEIEGDGASRRRGRADAHVIEGDNGRRPTADTQTSRIRIMFMSLCIDYTLSHQLMKVSSSWRLQRTETTRDNDSFVKFIIRSSCPTEGDVTKIKPIQVVNNNSLRRKVDASQRSFHVFMPPRICSTLFRLQQPNKNEY